jgi:hypothetical protein
MVHWNVSAEHARAGAGGQRLGTASVVAAIGFGAAVFMLGFLIALLREGAPSVFYRVVPTGGRSKKQKDLEGLRRIYGNENCCATESDRSERYRQLLENLHHEKGTSGSGLITLDVRTISGGVGWRAIHPKRSFTLRERRL